jgi:SPP1 gp7 family putative phage head morphogenesis protein
MTNLDYWAHRSAKAQEKLTSIGIAKTEKQLLKYYAASFEKILGQFELTYNKVFLRIEEGKQPTPADLYKLDKYWQMQGQLTQELQKLGDKQAALLSKEFTTHYQNVYDALAMRDVGFFSEIDTATAQQMINQIWCADGKSWSARIWENTSALQETLNNNLIYCVATGKTTGELKQLLQDSFNVSFSKADALVRTEMAHIQTQAAKKRYEDYGIQEVEILADKDERRCDICGKLHEKRFPIGAEVPIPAHPRCRCCIVPVV